MATSTLKMLRELNDYTQEYIAEDILKISQPSYARLEQDPSKIKAEHAQKLADLYKVSIANLLSEATPIITFKDTIDVNNGLNGYTNMPTNNFHEGEVSALKAQNEILIKQNTELMELVRVLGGKLANS
ncbi:helix-turn-helix domain-containing protein [Sediminibacterium ginsengisoli]|uniref:Helix-turn-helix n=1 Tax=Sediminibacterium ginsengisoli TaxID=413434 RepID=A0A1T4NXT5_9BACT|nr:helix-turn-helix transcriptional regulator [Sediminibacterium ginsengisoli]SJZ84180.1 Helix-turn-helix [Sediminibacterium ginsengisoli]